MYLLQQKYNLIENAKIIANTTFYNFGKSKFSIGVASSFITFVKNPLR